MSAHRKDHIPVYMDLISYRHRRRLALHTRLTLLITLGLIVAGWAGLLISEYRLGGVLAETGLLDRVVQTWLQSVSTRTAGFAGFESFANVRQESRLLIVLALLQRQPLHRLVEYPEESVLVG